MTGKLTAAAAGPTVKIENARIRVVEWRFPPGGATGWHRHEHNYVVVPLTTGTLKLVGDGGDEDRLTELVTGEPYARELGVEHDVVNVNDYEFVFIEVEIK